MKRLHALRERLDRLDDRLPWFKYAGLALLIALSWWLSTRANPPVPAGTPGILELQVAGTQETVASLLAAADRPTLRGALYWDYPLIALYGLGLPLLLILFRADDEPSRWDRHVPWLPVIAAGLDLVQNAAVHAELGNNAAAVGDWLPALAATSCLASWTLITMAALRLAWLVLRRALGLGPLQPARPVPPPRT